LFSPQIATWAVQIPPHLEDARPRWRSTATVDNGVHSRPGVKGNERRVLGVLPANEPHAEAQVNRRTTMKKLTMFLLAALAAAMVAIGGLASTPSASARNDDDTPIQNQGCWLHTSAGTAVFPHGTVITVYDAKANRTQYKCNNGIWEKVPMSPTTTLRYTGSLAGVVTRL
jgi:hypothetical protein